jgi:CheY-like chemotaxis protein
MMILERHGMRTVSVSTGAAAIEQARRSPGEFGLALVDMSMPGMNGTEVVRALREIIPGLPSIVMTGYSSSDVQHQLREVDVDAVIEKPFRPDDLIRAVSEVLDRTNAG